MIDYVARAQRALERWQAQADSDRPNAIPELEHGPESLRELVEERAVASGETQPSQKNIDDVSITSVLNATGVRIMRLDGGYTIGIWSDLDGPETRRALYALEMDGLPIRFLDRPGIPLRYKSRRVD